MVFNQTQPIDWNRWVDPDDETEHYKRVRGHQDYAVMAKKIVSKKFKPQFYGFKTDLKPW